MKILYAIQGTGNGHISRAREIIPILQRKGRLDLLISGIQSDLSLPYPIKYKLTGLSYIFGKSGGVDFYKTFLKCDSALLVKEIKKLPVEKYDLVINDFEPVSSWACFFKDIPCISLSHQNAVSSPNSPKPKRLSFLGKFILRNYAPANHYYGFHFDRYNENIFLPVIRDEVRKQKPEDRGHFTVYLPAYDDDRLINIFKELKDWNWEVFSKHNKWPKLTKNVSVRPIDNESFIKSMASSHGVLCGAGFETPAEALFLKKKLMVVPMKNQYEQHCNAAALESMGVPVLPGLSKKYIPEIEKWIKDDRIIEVNYPDETEKIIDLILDKHIPVPQVKVFDTTVV